VTRHEERTRLPGIRKEIREEIVTEHRHRRPQSTFTETCVDIDEPPRRYDTPIDQIEREYRSRSTSPPPRAVSYAGSAAGRSSHSHSSTSLTLHRPHRHHHHHHHHRPLKETTVVDEVTIDYPPRRHSISSAPSRVSDADETTVDVPTQQLAIYRPQRPQVPDEIVEPSTYAPKPKMPSYYDDMEKEGGEVVEFGKFLESETVVIPTHHIRIGDILILQGRPCQVIRISTSSATGQHRYLGVDLFTKQLHEESSSVTNPAPSVVVQTMRGPIFKQYRVLDIADGTVVAMTETGDVKQGLPVIDQSNLWSRLKKSFESGRGSVRILVVSDHGREMAVDMKVVHGSRL
jgi:translation elongation factor P/translation initiation factor 5A